MTKDEILKDVAAMVRYGGQPGAEAWNLTTTYLFAVDAKQHVENIRDGEDVSEETISACDEIVIELNATIEQGLPTI